MSNCIFCKITNHEIGSQTLYEDDTCMVILDLSQSTRGHSLVISKQHYSSILEVDDQTLSHMMIVAKKMANQIKTSLNANGVNILTNAGETAGQTVMHFHIHIIPRYDDQDGFDPVFTNHEGEYDLATIKQEIINEK